MEPFFFFFFCGGIWFPILILAQSCRELENLLIINHFFPTVTDDNFV